MAWKCSYPKRPSSTQMSAHPFNMMSSSTKLPTMQTPAVIAKELPPTPPSLIPSLNPPKHPGHLTLTTPHLVATLHPAVTQHLGVIPLLFVTLSLPQLSSAALEVQLQTQDGLPGGETTRAGPFAHLPPLLISPGRLHHHPGQSASQSAPVLCHHSHDQTFPP